MHICHTTKFNGHTHAGVGVHLSVWEREVEGEKKWTTVQCVRLPSIASSLEMVKVLFSSTTVGMYKCILTNAPTRRSVIFWMRQVLTVFKKELSPFHMQTQLRKLFIIIICQPDALYTSCCVCVCNCLEPCFGDHSLKFAIKIPLIITGVYSVRTCAVCVTFPISNFRTRKSEISQKILQHVNIQTTAVY